MHELHFFCIIQSSYIKMVTELCSTWKFLSWLFSRPYRVYYVSAKNYACGARWLHFINFLSSSNLVQATNFCKLAYIHPHKSKFLTKTQIGVGVYCDYYIYPTVRRLRELAISTCMYWIQAPTAFPEDLKKQHTSILSENLETQSS